MVAFVFHIESDWEQNLTLMEVQQYDTSLFKQIRTAAICELIANEEMNDPERTPQVSQRTIASPEEVIDVINCEFTHVDMLDWLMKYSRTMYIIV